MAKRIFLGVFGLLVLAATLLAASAPMRDIPPVCPPQSPWCRF
jgi:hypothetical protein